MEYDTARGGQFAGVACADSPLITLHLSRVCGYTGKLSRIYICRVSRYAGKLAGLYPSDPIEALKCDEMLDALEQLYGDTPCPKPF